MLNRKLVIRAALAMVAGLGIASSSWGTTTVSSPSITVSTNVIQKCTISTPGTFVFPNYDPFSTTVDTQTGTLTITCTKGSTLVTVGMTLGLKPAQTTNGARAMEIGTTANYLGYDIFQPSVAGTSGTCTTTSWTTSATVAGSGSFGLGAPLTFNICGSIQAGQDAVVGAYQDTVQAQVNF